MRQMRHIIAALVYQGDKMVRGGRPKSASPKEVVNLRLDSDVLGYSARLAPAGRAALTKVFARQRGSSRRVRRKGCALYHCTNLAFGCGS